MQRQPTSAQDFLDQGVQEEESGDRWIISDLSKSLRFYQRAYEQYLRALALDPGLIDGFYNANRLLYHVWETYHAVSPSSLSNVEGCDVARFGLWDIKEKHELVLGKFGESVNWELLYNLVLINTELLERAYDDDYDGERGYPGAVRLCEESVRLVLTLLDYQVGELDSFLRKLGSPESDEERGGKNGNGEGEDEDEDDDDYDVVEQVTPSVILESIVTGAKFMLTAYEGCDNYVQINSLKNVFTSSGFQARLQEVLQLLMSKFIVENNPQDDFNLNFKDEEIEEVKLVNHSINAVFINDFNQLVVHWEGLEGGSASRFMAEADSFQNFKDRNNELTSQQQWGLINHINSNLKKAQGLVNQELTVHTREKTNEVSSKVSKMIEILISRADNEILRSSFQDLESSIKNREVLRQNAINLLKSGLNMGNTNCGLRETISDRLKREKLKRECVIRLVVITREGFGEEDLIRNLGRDHYLNEVDDLKSNAVYRCYF